MFDTCSRTFLYICQVRGTDGTWQFIARVKHVRETPVSRGDAYSLVEEFESAMAVMDKQKDGPEGRVEAFTSPMQNDMHALQVSTPSVLYGEI